MLIAGDPGLGKTRLVYECRKLFMAWVGAASGRLPLWLEGKAASYASSRVLTASTSNCSRGGWEPPQRRVRKSPAPPSSAP